MFGMLGRFTGGTIPLAFPNSPVTRLPKAPPIAAACCMGVAEGAGSAPGSAQEELKIYFLQEH